MHNSSDNVAGVNAVDSRERSVGRRGNLTNKEHPGTNAEVEEQKRERKALTLRQTNSFWGASAVF